MVRTDLLRGLIAQKGLSQRKVAHAMKKSASVGA